MRVACVNQDPGIAPGSRKGAAVHLAALREAFCALDADVVACDVQQADALRELLERAHAEAPVDLVYERYALGGAEGSRFAARHGLAHVIEVNAPLLEEARLWRGQADDGRLAAIEREVFSAARTIIAVSREAAASVMARGVPDHRVLVRPNAVDTEVFRSVPRNGSVGGVPLRDEAFVVGFHGRLRPWHGLPLLARAVAGLLARGVDAVLVLAGEGDWREALGDALPAERTILIDWRPQAQLAPIVSRFDALALTYDGQHGCWFSPLKLLEAMACGAVPVVPALGDLGDVVRHGENGLVYPAGDEEALVAALERLARDRQLRTALSAAAVASTGGRTWRALAREILQLVPAGASP